MKIRAEMGRQRALLPLREFQVDKVVELEDMSVYLQWDPSAIGIYPARDQVEVSSGV